MVSITIEVRIFMTSLIEDFASLFAGNLRSFGRWDPSSGSMTTEKGEVKLSNYADHIEGRVGLGVVPVTDGGTCLFGAIDVDKHDTPEDIDFKSIQAKIDEYRLPLVMCRTKRGGAHLYLFGQEYLPAKQVQRILANWRDMLEIPYKTEIFPKQDSLITSGGEKALGNWINLCYFDAANTKRYALDDDCKPCHLSCSCSMHSPRG